MQLLKTLTLFGEFNPSWLEKSLDLASSTRPRSPMSLNHMLNRFLNFSFKFTSIISAFLCVVHSPVLKAEDQNEALKKVEAIAFIPQQIWMKQLKTQLEGAKIGLDHHIDQYEYASQDGSIRFVSDRVNFAALFQANFPSTSLSPAIDLSLQLNEANVQVSNFNLAVVIQKDLGFGTATLNLDMHCDAINLRLNNNHPAAAQIRIDKGQFSLSQLDWNLKNSQLQTELIGCKEIAGFDQLLKEQIQQLIEQKFVVEILQQAVNSQINDLVSQKISFELNKYADRLKLAKEQTTHFDEQNNLWLYSGANLELIFTNEEIQKIKNSPKAVLMIKKKSLDKLAKDILNESLRAHIISSKENKSMNRLTCSRLIQTFVWPSLKSLSKCFNMQIQNQVQEFSITDIRSLSFSLKMGSWASGEGHDIAYFQSTLTANLSQAQASMTSFLAQSQPEFIKWSGRSKRISTSLIKPTLQNLLDLTIVNLKENEVFKMIQKSMTFKQLSSETYVIEMN
jgi:hypothetical protein